MNEESKKKQEQNENPYINGESLFDICNSLEIKLLRLRQNTDSPKGFIMEKKGQA